MAWRRTRVLFYVGVAIGLLVLTPLVLALAGPTAPVQDGVPLSAPDGMTATLTGSTNALLEDFSTASESVRWQTDAGNITFSAPGDAAATVNTGDITGTFTVLSSIDATGNDVTANPEDKQSVVIGGDVTDLEWPAASAVGLDDGTVDFRYTVSGGGSGQLTIGSVAPNTQVAAVDSVTGTIVGDATSDGSGELTFTSLDDGSHDVQLQQFNPAAPTLANPSPTGGLQQEPSQLSIDVADTEFGSGDTVTVTVELDGSQVHQTTVASNQTVTAAIPASGKTGGQHDWTVNATDSFGRTTTEAYSYSVPDTLYIRHVHDHGDLVNTPVSLNGTFYGEPNIFVREQVTDGTVNMTGLPVNQDFVFSARPNASQYTQRTLYVKSIFQQQDLYLLNATNVSTIESRFVLNDPTGQYDASSVLFIQRGINISGNTSWQTVHSDRFGVEGVTAVLEEGVRYRIKVTNDAGDTQVVGPYRADASETVDVVPGTPTIELSDFSEGWAADASLDNATLEYRFDDPANLTDQLTVWIHEQGDKTNKLTPNSTFVDLGTASGQETLSPAEKNQTWVVNFIVTRNGSTFTHSVSVSNRQPLFQSIGPNWRLMIGVGTLFLLAGVFSMLNAAIGGVIVALVGGLWWWIGLLDGATTGAAVIIALFIAAINHARQSGGP